MTGREMTGREEKNLPAIVVGSGVTTLGVIRCLGRRGVPVRVAGMPDRLVRQSRWFSPAGPEGSWDPDGRLADNLAALEVEAGVLIPCTDSLALSAAELPEAVKRVFPSYQCSARSLRKLVDKGAFLAALVTAEVPHPRTYLVDGEEDLANVPSTSDSRPFFIKPRDSQSFFRLEGRKGLFVTSRTDLEAKVHEFRGRGHRLMVQEYVPGPASNHYFVDGFVDDGGRIVTHLVRRRLRMYPTDFGNSSFVVTVPKEEGAAAVSALGRLFREVSYRGVFSAEFKRDEDDGMFRILEVNARPWWYIEFAARAGMNVAYMVYEAAQGLSPSIPDDYEVGRKLIYPYYDFQACMVASTHFLTALWTFLNDAVGADDPVFAWDDPRPALNRWRRTVTRYLGSRLLPGRRASGERGE